MTDAERHATIVAILNDWQWDDTLDCIADAIIEAVPPNVAVYEGKVKTNPSTLYMDGTSPVVVCIRATNDHLRAMHNKTVRLLVDFDDDDADV